MKQYVAEFPAVAQAREQLPHAVAELSTHDNQRVTTALNDGLQAALTGVKPAEQAMKDAQRAEGRAHPSTVSALRWAWFELENPAYAGRLIGWSA